MAASLAFLAAAAIVVAPLPGAEGLYLLPGTFAAGHQPDGNTVVLEGQKELVVFDTGRHKAHRKAILEFAQGRGKPIAAIVNSHWHLDHVSGNPDLKAAYPGARVYASDAIDEALTGFLANSARQGREMLEGGKLEADRAEELRGDLATIENGQALKPDVVVTRSQTVRLAGRALDIHLAPHAATAGDLWLYDPKSRTAMVGDLVTLPAPFLDTACAAGWSRALDEVERTPFVRLVSGHGPVMTRDDFGRYRTAFTAFVACARTDKPAAICAGEWATAVGPLLGDDPVQPRAAKGMASYYVEQVLRGGGEARSGCSSSAT